VTDLSGCVSVVYLWLNPKPNLAANNMNIELRVLRKTDMHSHMQ
jgi:hypothetical protein